MDGKHEIEEDMLPIRKERGKDCTEKFKAYADIDPRITGWRKFTRGNFSFKHQERIAGIEYFIDKLITTGTKVEDIYACVENVMNMREAVPEDKWNKMK